MGTLSRYLGYGAVFAALLTVASFLRSGEPSTPMFAITFLLVAGTMVMRSIAKKNEADGGEIAGAATPTKKDTDTADHAGGGSGGDFGGDGGGADGGGG